MMRAPTSESIKRAPARRRYYLKHRAKLIAAVTAWKRTRPEKTREMNRAYRAANLEKERVRGRLKMRIKRSTPEGRKLELSRAQKRRAADPDKYRAQQRRRYLANQQKERARMLAGQKANPEKNRAASAMRRAAQLMASPSWVDRAANAAIYDEAVRLGLTVDHVVPLKGRNVSGLHVQWNLQLLTQDANRRKGNRFGLTEGLSP